MNDFVIIEYLIRESTQGLIFSGVALNTSNIQIKANTYTTNMQTKAITQTKDRYKSKWLP